MVSDLRHAARGIVADGGPTPMPHRSARRLVEATACALARFLKLERMQASIAVSLLSEMTRDSQSPTWPLFGVQQYLADDGRRQARIKATSHGKHR